MSDESLYSQHWRLIDKDPSTWSEADRKEFERLQSLRLPPLPDVKKPFWQFGAQWKMAFASVAALSILVLLIFPAQEILHPKGILQVHVYWERDGKSQPFTEQTILQDGDRIGASVLSSDKGVAYWAITDSQMKLISEVSEDDQVVLEPATLTEFKKFSFALTAPNQGENLVVIICPEKVKRPAVKELNTALNEEFVSRLLSEQKIRTSDCVFVGYRLRRQP